MKYQIFSEGKLDESFLREFIKYILGVQFNPNEFTFPKTGGYTKIRNLTPLFNDNTDQGGKNLLIFDADFILTNGGHIQRMKYLLDQRRLLNIKFEVFLFPNNQDEGEIENLLEQIVPIKHKRIFNCFTTYENCISQYGYHTPDNKAKIFAYLEAQTPRNRRQELTNSFKDGDYFFYDPLFWDLDSDYLLPLKTFILSNMLHPNISNTHSIP